MDHTERHSDAPTSGCKNCGNCKKSGCGSIAAALKADGAMGAFVSQAGSAPAGAEAAHILAAE